jgi:glycosyltransferase involved in cell wall biosynthesis
MRIARGIQNKVLEGMAMGKPVIVTSKGLEGIKAQAGKDILLADRPEEFETQLVAILNHEHESMGARARNYVCQQCSWRSSLKHFVGFIENTNP